MSSRQKKPRATYADIEKLPDYVNGELIDGELFVSPRPAPTHAVTHGALIGALNGFFQLGTAERPGGWWILPEPELHFGDDVLIPDIGGWRRERLPVMPKTAYFETPPDWVCEVASPSTSRVDVVHKMPIYGRCGVAFAWIIDPLRKTLEAFARVGARWELVRGFSHDDRARIEPFEELELDLSLLWSPEIPSVHSKKETYET